jgi:phosphoribosylformylglycinamidine (FGAM) synthase-like enzyme
VSHGGLLVTLAEMMTASLPFALGCAVDLTDALTGTPRVDGYLFSEFGGVVVEVDAGRWSDFERLLSQHGARWLSLGETTEDAALIVHWQNGRVDVTLSEAEDARRTKGMCNPLFA